MSRLKKFVASALAVVLCATSIAAKAPAQAEAAAYCNHTIRKVGTQLLGGYSYVHTGTSYKTVYDYSYIPPKPEVWAVPYSCTVTGKIYKDTFACNKCSYSYTSTYTAGESHSCTYH